jgi:hypothetical protein
LEQRQKLPGPKRKFLERELSDGLPLPQLSSF